MKKVIYEGDGNGFYRRQVFSESMKSLGKSVVTYLEDWNAFESVYVWDIKDLGMTLKYHKTVEPSRIPEQKVRVIAFGGRKKISGLEDRIKSAEAKWNTELQDDLAESAIAGMSGYRSQIQAVLKKSD